MRSMMIAVVALLVCLLDFTSATAQTAGPDGNLRFPPQESVRRMCDEPFEIAEHKEAGGGVMGAQHWHLSFHDGEQMEVKWKRAPDGGDGWNNSPRYESAAYVAQQLYLDP